MNLPNSISLIRILLVPIIIVLMLVNSNSSIVINDYHLATTWLVAGILFIISSLTDFLDGFLARKLNKVTTFGKFFDAIADKFLVNSVLIVMSYVQIIPIWVTLILICRDILIDALRQILAAKQVILAANWAGKIKTFVLMVGISILFFVSYQNFNNEFPSGKYSTINQLLLIPTYFGTLLSIYSAGVYLFTNHKHLLNNKKK